MNFQQPTAAVPMTKMTFQQFAGTAAGRAILLEVPFGRFRRFVFLTNRFHVVLFVAGEESRILRDNGDTYVLLSANTRRGIN